MKKSIIVGNWKANKTVEEAREWIKEMANGKPASPAGGWQTANSPEVVVCPPFVILPALKEKFAILNSQFSIHLGAQDISQFEDGPYTGEVTGRMLKNLVDYVLIGHSERRKYFGENDEVLKMKVKMALEAKLKPIYCISEAGMFIPEGVEIVAYEPLFAIGSGKPDTPENANEVASEIKKRYAGHILYGGSVKPDNVKGFLSQPNIDGVLPGGASLRATDFLEIIQNAV